jgi:hypothetical protein
MFSKEEVEAILQELRQQWGGDPGPADEHGHHPMGTNPEWEKLVRQAYLGMARADAGVALGDLDPRVIAVIQKYQQRSAQKVS